MADCGLPAGVIPLAGALSAPPRPRARQLQNAVSMKPAHTSTPRPKPPRKPRVTAKASSNGFGLSPDAISQRAYEIFEARGGMGGDPLADWLQAEAELGAGSSGH